MAKKKPQQPISKELKDEQLNTIIGGVSLNGTSTELVNIVQTTTAPQRIDKERDLSYPLRNVSMLQAESAIQEEDTVVHPEIPFRK